MSTLQNLALYLLLLILYKLVLDNTFNHKTLLYIIFYWLGGFVIAIGTDLIIEPEKVYRWPLIAILFSIGMAVEIIKKYRLK